MYKRPFQEPPRHLIKLCQDLKLAGEDEMADKLCCALSALAGNKQPRYDLSYSYVMRFLRKEHADLVPKFQETFSKAFYQALEDELEDPDQLALLESLKHIDVKVPA